MQGFYLLGQTELLVVDEALVSIGGAVLAFFSVILGLVVNHRVAAANREHERQLGTVNSELAVANRDHERELSTVNSELARQRTMLEQQGSRISGANTRRVECLEQIYEATAIAQSAVKALVDPDLFEQRMTKYEQRLNNAWKAVVELNARFRRWDYYVPTTTARRWSIVVSTLEYVLRTALVAREAERREMSGSENWGDLAKTQVERMEGMRQQLANDLRELLGLEFENLIGRGESGPKGTSPAISSPAISSPEGTSTVAGEGGQTPS